MLDDLQFRRLQPSDFPFIRSVVNDWWGGRNVAEMLPKLFFIHFQQTSFAAARDGNIIGFLVGFVSQTFNNEAYIHFVGVHPQYRKNGLGAALYERFFDAVQHLGCNVVRCITSPVNKGSIAFHHRMGFLIEPSGKIIDDIPVVENYDGSGGDRVLFYKMLGPTSSTIKTNKDYIGD
jgi:ribosomal protein S18 acetylase RimI-like enzyme